MTVEENALLPTPRHPGERAWQAIARTNGVAERETQARERAHELLEFFELLEMRDAYASSLSGGQRKLLEFARALVLDPDLLLLDEPFAGINPTLTESILDYVEQLNAEGVTFLVIEHDVETLAELVDRIVVLSDGRVLATGDPDTVLADERVIETYLGDG